ncbi:MAG TPA: hypothetical protein VF071_03370 [Candidatus Limnocylindria bacterium]
MPVAREPRRPHIRTALLAAGLALALAACTAPGARSTPAASIQHPGGDELVLRVEHRGGFVPAEYHLVRLPTFTLLGDGRAVVSGAMPAIYPGPLRPSLLERRLTEAGMQAVLRAALESGQLDADAEWRGVAQFVADASDEVFILNADGRSVTVSVYALGIAGGGEWDLPAKERAAHEALAELSGKLQSLDTWLPADAWADDEWRPFRPDAIRLVVRNADADQPGTDELPFRSEPWPVPGDPAAFGAPAELDGWRCGVVSGPEAEAWYAALEQADQLTRWIGGGHRYQVWARPLLPDEPLDCDPLL